MQKGIRKHAWLYVVVAVLIAVMLVSLYYQFGYLPQKQSGTSSQETVGSVGGQSITSSQEPVGSVGGPMIFATLSFSNATGFVRTVHPTSGAIEFVLLPNSVGEFTVSYTSPNNLTATIVEYAPPNNLTVPMFSFTDPVGVSNVNLSNGTFFGTGSGLSVTESSLTWVSIHQVVVTYTVNSEGSETLYNPFALNRGLDGLYVLWLPSAGLSTIIDVGTQPYTGPLTWLNGIVY